MVKRRTWFILVVAMLLAAVGGYDAYIHFLAPAGTPQEPALQRMAEAMEVNSSDFTPTAVLTDTPTATPTPTVTSTLTPLPTPTHPLMIEVMRQQAYPGSEITIEETLDPGSNYDRYIASYLSEGLKIYALLTVPRGEKPESGWPVIIFNHGYIPPDQYRTTERYVAYVDAFARNGYIVFKSDYRGHGTTRKERRRADTAHLPIR